MTYFNNHTHSEFSNSSLGFPDAVSKIPELIQRAYDIGLGGFALTDHESVSGHVRALQYYNSMGKDRDFKLALGNEIYLMSEEEDEGNRNHEDYTPYYHFILTALDTEGHKQIRKLSTKAWLRGYMRKGIMRKPTYYSDIEEIIKPNQGHVIMSSACFTKNHKVLTLEGLKNIQDITSDDKVMTANGTWEDVISPTKRLYSGPGNKIRFAKSTRPTLCTNTHKFLVFNKKTKKLEWVIAEKLKKNDNCISPIYKINYTNYYTFDFTKELSLLREKENRSIKRINRINNVINLTPELMRTFGLWLADGHIRYNKDNKNVGFSFNENDFPNYYIFVKQGMSAFGDINPTIVYRKKNHKVEINYNSKELAYIWKEIFGLTHADTKKIPQKLLHINKNMDMELLYGYLLGDGYFRVRTITGMSKKQYYSSEIVSATISEQLHEDILNLYLSLGYSPNIIIAKEKISSDGVHHQTAFYLTLSCKDLCLTLNKQNILCHKDLVNILTQYSYDKNSFIVVEGMTYLRQRVKENIPCELNEEVYCLNVANEHNFVCNNTIVHNCLGSYIDKQILEWQSGNELAKQKVHDFIQWCIDTFGKGNVFLEIQPCKESNKEQTTVNPIIWELGEQYNIPVIATTDAHYLSKDTAFIHKTFLESKDGDREVDEFYATAYLMDSNELRDYLQLQFTDEQIGIMFQNSMKIHERVQDYELEHMPVIPQIPEEKLPRFKIEHRYKKYYEKYPEFSYYASVDNVQDSYFFYRIEQALLHLVEEKGKDIEVYIDRLNKEFHELRLISETFNSSMASYYTSMSKIIELVWEADSLSMPSRGSAMGYLVCYLLEITQIDPVPLGDYAPYWRHLSAERGVEIPDIDNDSQASRKKAIAQALKDYFGEDKVLNVATFTELTSKTAIERSCKGLKIPDEVAGYLKSLIPVERGKIWSLTDCLQGNEGKGRKRIPEFDIEISKYEHLKECALALEGMIVNRGVHAAGLTVSNDPYVESISAILSPKSVPCTCYDLLDAEYCSQVKFDMLTVEASDKIRTTMDLLIQHGHMEWQGTLKDTYWKYLHPEVLNYDNPEMWDMIRSIYSVFQFDTTVSVRALNQTNPKSVMDLSAANSLLRLMAQDGQEAPIEKFARFKEDINNWYHEMDEYGLNQDEQECLKEHLSASYGLAPTQESVMLLSMDKRISGFGLKDANKLRKVIAKKQDKDLNAMKELFYNSCEKMGTRKKLADYVWNVLFAMSFGYVIMVMFGEPVKGV